MSAPIHAVQLVERCIVYCPECGDEYRDGLTECSDCRVPLLPGSPLADLAVVLETNDRVHFAMAKGLLEDAGIPLFVHGQIATLVQDVDGFLHKWVRLEVPRVCAAEAREVLEPLLHPIPIEGADT